MNTAPDERGAPAVRVEGNLRRRRDPIRRHGSGREGRRGKNGDPDALRRRVLFGRVRRSACQTPFDLERRNEVKPMAAMKTVAANSGHLTWPSP